VGSAEEFAEFAAASPRLRRMAFLLVGKYPTIIDVTP
jgi:hypothetical protein